MAVVPRSMFAVDGSLMVCKEKSSLMSLIEQAERDVTVENKDDSYGMEERIPDETQQIPQEERPQAVPQNNSVPPDRVLIVDAMAVVQGLKKTPGVESMHHLKNKFLQKIEKMGNSYDEIRVIFDQYIEGGLKSNTRAGRATSKAANQASYDVHDQMSIKTLSLKELLSSSKTKHSLTIYFAEGLLKYFHGSSKKCVVSYQTFTKVNFPHVINDDVSEHQHEEADTLSVKKRSVKKKFGINFGR